MAPGTASTMAGVSSPAVRSSTWRELGDGRPRVDAVGGEAGEVDGVASRSIVGAGELQEIVHQRAEAVGLLDRPRRARSDRPASRRLWRFSRRSFSAVSGERSWCEASATNVRWAASSSSRRSAIVAIESASARSSGGPPAGRGADGEVAVGEAVGVGLQPSDRACHRAGQPPSDERDEAEDDDGDGCESEPEAVDSGGDVAGVDREAQCAVHRAAWTRPVRRRRGCPLRACPRIGCLSPAVRCSASAISGRVEKSRSMGPPVSTSEMPSRSTTTTRAPVRSRYASGGRGVERPVVLEVVLVERGEHGGVVLEVGGDSLALALGEEHGERDLEEHEGQHRDQQVARQEATRQDRAPAARPAGTRRRAPSRSDRVRASCAAMRCGRRASWSSPTSSRPTRRASAALVP